MMLSTERSSFHLTPAECRYRPLFPNDEQTSEKLVVLYYHSRILVIVFRFDNVASLGLQKGIQCQKRKLLANSGSS